MNLKSKQNVKKKLDEILTQFNLKSQVVDIDTSESNIQTKSTLQIEEDKIEDQNNNQIQHLRRGARIRTIQESFQELQANGTEIIHQCK